MFVLALFREDRKKCARLVREKRVNSERIELMRADVREMLEKKFGRQVSVAKLESLIVDPHVVELRQDQQDFGLACTQELRDWNVRRAFARYLRATNQTRHTASTSMHSLTFRVRVATPEHYGRNGTASLQITSHTQQARRFYRWCVRA